MVIFLRANDLTSDPRARKYLDHYRENGINFMVICWNRSGSEIPYPPNYFVYRKQTGYNLGKKAILSRITFNFFIFRILLRHRKKFSVIHACDFDTVLPALPFRMFGKTVIFDIFDMFSYTIKTNFIIDYLIGLLENISVKAAGNVIICEEERINQIRPFFRNPRTWVLPNIPVEKITGPDAGTRDEFFGKDLDRKLILSYVGAFYHGRFLAEIMQTISEVPEVTLIMAGFGDPEIETMCSQYAERFPNISYPGRVNYGTALQIMSRSDLLIGMYCLTNRNHYYAAPNKFYESLMLKKPLITSRGTAVGDKVTRYDTGFAINDTREELLSLVMTIQKDPSIMISKSINCGIIWEKEFKNYVPGFLSGTYAKMIGVINKN